MITIQVLGFGELFQQLLNAVAAFMGQSFFNNFLRLTALIGIIMASIGFIKERNPLIYGKWIMSYVLVLQLVLTPKTDVAIYDIAAQRDAVVSNVPVVFATAASLITSVGVGLAESYDALLSLPDDLTYTKTGSLFGSKLIQASRDFRILDPKLKAEMNEYLRNCVVGDIRLNHKYSVSDLSTTQHIWDLISKNASPLRMTEVNNTRVSCKTAALPSGPYSLKANLDMEVKKAYTIFGVELFGHTRSTYEKLFETHLTSSFDYYQMMTDSSADIFLQSMMINAIGDGIKDYQAFTDSTAGVVNNQVTKSQVQHRWSWAIAGLKAAWFLPILHTLLTALLFGIFPVIMAMATLPNGTNIFRGYIQFFISLQFWPVLFAILNAAMTLYGKEQSAHFGGLNLVNIDKIDELHADLSGVAGYLMLMIPFLAKGLVSNLSEAFNNLATSMTGHLQGSAMSVANDAASASFSFGQTSFYNSSANNYSANKHDNNFTHMHGMHAEQLATGVVKTHTASGNTVFDVSPGMSRNAVSVNSVDGLSGSLNEAFEASKQTSVNAHQSFQTSVSNFAHKALQLSEMHGHDVRLGDGVSQSETGQYQEALSSMSHIASDVSKRTGVSEEEALTQLTSASLNGRINAPKMLTDGLRTITRGLVDVKLDVSGQASRTSTSADRAHQNVDASLSAKEAHDFNEAFSHVKNVVQNRHLDNSHSESAHLSSQMGADLRDAQTASQQYDAAFSRGERISQAQSYVKSHGDQITKNMDQAFSGYVASHVGKHERDRLFSNPEDQHALQTLQQLGDGLLREERESIIAKATQHRPVEATYPHNLQELKSKSTSIQAGYETAAKDVHHAASAQHLGVSNNDINKFEKQANSKSADYTTSIDAGEKTIHQTVDELAEKSSKKLDVGSENAKRGVAWRPLRKNDEDSK